MENIFLLEIKQGDFFSRIDASIWERLISDRLWNWLRYSKLQIIFHRVFLKKRIYWIRCRHHEDQQLVKEWIEDNLPGTKLEHILCMDNAGCQFYAFRAIFCTQIDVMAFKLSWC